MKKLILPLILILLVGLLSPAIALSGDDFNDITPGVWYYESVDFVVRKGLFNGTADSVFSPGAKMSRAMFVTVLGRSARVSDENAYGIITKTNVNVRSEASLYGEILKVLPINTIVKILGMENGWYGISHDGVTGYVRGDLMGEYGGPFSDLPSNQYYTPYVIWAYCEGIVSGVGASHFAPSGDVSREQICVILYNFAAAQGLTLPLISEQGAFDDDALISSWAKEAVYILRNAGVVNGKENNRFQPGDGATRAEVAAFLHRFIVATGMTIPDAEVDPNEPTQPQYSYGDNVPASSPVTNAYFSDACFIGHSLVTGMDAYLGIAEADYYGVSGITAEEMLVYNSLTYPVVVKDEFGRDIETYKTGTLADALEANSYGKVYIMFGVNELGPAAAHKQSFYNSVSSIVDIVRARQPNAVVYLISLTPIGFMRSITSDYYNRENALSYNAALREICASKQVHYLDVFSALSDDEGYLDDMFGASDGIHLLYPAYSMMNSYFKTHTVSW